MATASLPILAGYTLPAPKEQSYKISYRGGALKMANGKTVHDLVDNSPHLHFRLRWEFLTAAQVSTITIAWGAIKNTTGSFTSVEGAVFTVTRPDDGEVDVVTVNTAKGELKYHVALELLEDG